MTTISQNDRWIGSGTSLAFSALLSLSTMHAETISLDPDLPDYKPSQQLSGPLVSMGSQTMQGLMKQWFEEFQRLHPQVTAQAEGLGSDTALVGLITGLSQLAPMSRRMDADEVLLFEFEYGHKPRLIAVALDAVGIYVHKDNPLHSLTLEQVEWIFSYPLDAGTRSVRRWRDFGVSGDWAGRPIQRYGQRPVAGPHKFLRDLILESGEFRMSVRELGDCSSVRHTVATDPAAIGYASLAGKADGVKALSVSLHSDPVVPSQKTASDLSYPISRHLYIYVNKDPVNGLDPVVKEFLSYVLSKQGQRVATEHGYFPISKEKRKEMLLELETDSGA